MGNNSIKKIETDKLIIEGHLLKWDNVTIQISNISSVTAWEIKSRFPMIVIILAIIGAVFLYTGSSQYGYRYSPDSGIMILSGIGGVLVIAAAVCLFVWWMDGPKKYLNICMNSGITYSILFQDKYFMEKVLQVFAAIFKSGKSVETNISVNISDSKFSGGSSVIKEINELIKN